MLATIQYIDIGGLFGNANMIALLHLLEFFATKSDQSFPLFILGTNIRYTRCAEEVAHPGVYESIQLLIEVCLLDCLSGERV